MTAHDRFIRFKELHRAGMALAQVERPILTSANGSSKPHVLQDTLHLPDQLPLWMRIREYLYKGWNPVVVNKSVDSITMPKWIASAILLTVLGFGVSSWWRASDQRDMLIELRTELKLAKEYEAERSKEAKAQADLNKVYIDNMTSQLNVIKGMLSAQQLSAVEKNTRGGQN